MAYASNAFMLNYYGSPCGGQRYVRVAFCAHNRTITVNSKAARQFRYLGRLIYTVWPELAREIVREPDTACYNCRRISGSSRWSNHAWATAVDQNWQENPQRVEWTQINRDPRGRKIIDQARRAGFAWGGDWSTPDNMHFETILTPAQINARFSVWGQPYHWYRHKKGLIVVKGLPRSL